MSENYVTYRGSMKDTNVIQLPVEWKGKVDLETISVSLTPIASYQELYVEKIEAERVIVKSASASKFTATTQLMLLYYESWGFLTNEDDEYLTRVVIDTCAYFTCIQMRVEKEKIIWSWWIYDSPWISINSCWYDIIVYSDAVTKVIILDYNNYIRITVKQMPLSRLDNFLKNAQ